MNTERIVQPQEDRSSSITIGIPDEHIGIVVGRGGRNIMEMSQVCIYFHSSFCLVHCIYLLLRNAA